MVMRVPAGTVAPNVSASVAWVEPSPGATAMVAMPLAASVPPEMVKAPSTSMAPWLASSVAETTSVPPVMAMVPLTSTPSRVVSIT
jgi:hypothetical protein